MSTDLRPKSVRIIDQLESEGRLKDLVECGLLHHRILRARKIWMMIDVEMKLGSKRMVAIQYVSECEGVSVQAIYDFLSLLEKPIMRPEAMKKAG